MGFEKILIQKQWIDPKKKSKKKSSKHKHHKTKRKESNKHKHDDDDDLNVDKGPTFDIASYKKQNASFFDMATNEQPNHSKKKTASTTVHRVRERERSKSIHSN